MVSAFQKCTFQKLAFQTTSCIEEIPTEKWGGGTGTKQVGVIAEPDWVHEKIKLNFTVTKKFCVENRVTLLLNRKYNATYNFNVIPYKNISLSNDVQIDIFKNYSILVKTNIDLIRKYKISKGFNIEVEDIVSDYFTLMSILEDKV